MDKVSLKLQVFFQDPFWIGICERISDTNLSVCKVTFGSEPKDYEVQEFLLNHWYQLRFSPTTEVTVKQKEKINPKRLQRDVKKQVQNISICTKSQIALKLQHDESKNARKEFTRKQKEEEQERLFALKQQRKKEKHKGR